MAVPLVIVLVVATVGRLLVLSPRSVHEETALLEGFSQHRSPVADVLATVIHVALSNAGVVVLIAAITGWLAVLRRRPLDATGFLLTSLSGWGAVGLVKALVGRPRPFLPEADPLLQVSGTTSFPSGHTGAVLAVVLALALVRGRPAAGAMWIGCAVVGLVGLSRIYAGAHYPLDVLCALPVTWAGVMVGCALANTVVPALAYGFGWHQVGSTTAPPAGGTAEGRRDAKTTSAARGEPAAEQISERRDDRAA